MFRPAKSLSEYQLSNQIVWFTLAFQAGFINVGGFLACHRFVTHMTGFATHFGVEAAQSQWQSAMGMLSVPIFFLLGSVISAFFIHSSISKNKEPRYDLVLGIMSTLMMIVLFFGTQGYFGTFGEPLILLRDYLLLAILALSSGLQNALVSSASGSVVRTTHLTGLTTDLGIGIAKVIWGSKNNPHHIEHESRANRMRMGLISSFVVGSLIGAILFMRFEYAGFFVPAILSVVLTISFIWLNFYRLKLKAHND